MRLQKPFGVAGPTQRQRSPRLQSIWLDYELSNNLTLATSDTGTRCADKDTHYGRLRSSSLGLRSRDWSLD